MSFVRLAEQLLGNKYSITSYFYIHCMCTVKLSTFSFRLWFHLNDIFLDNKDRIKVIFAAIYILNSILLMGFGAWLVNTNKILCTLYEISSSCRHYFIIYSFHITLYEESNLCFQSIFFWFQPTFVCKLNTITIITIIVLFQDLYFFLNESYWIYPHNDVITRLIIRMSDA